VAHPKAARMMETAEGGRAGPAALELRGVSKRYARAHPPVLDRIDLRVEPGETIAITGRNGAGKTTLLRIACGLIMCDSGSVHAFGVSPERQRREYQTQVGFLAAGNSGLYARLTVRQHLELWSRLALIPRDAEKARVAAMLAELDLADLADRRVDRMSMGQRQRVRIAMAFMHAPRLVMLDEPFNSLDDEGAMRLLEAIGGVVAHGGAVIVCSPTEAPADLRVDRYLQIRDGALAPR